MVQFIPFVKCQVNYEYNHFKSCGLPLIFAFTKWPSNQKIVHPELRITCKIKFYEIYCIQKYDRSLHFIEISFSLNRRNKQYVPFNEKLLILAKQEHFVTKHALI